MKGVEIGRAHRLDIIAGLVDGILNALVLATGKLTAPGGSGVTLELAFRVSAATAATTIFVFFVAHYAELRAELVHAERELNLLSHGKLATTRLGRQIVRESAVAASLAAACGTIGSIVPLLLSLNLPGPPLVSIALTISILGLLGVFLARTVFGSPISWALSLMLGGAMLAWMGSVLNIAG